MLKYSNVKFLPDSDKPEPDSCKLCLGGWRHHWKRMKGRWYSCVCSCDCEHGQKRHDDHGKPDKNGSMRRSYAPLATVYDMLEAQDKGADVLWQGPPPKEIVEKRPEMPLKRIESRSGYQDTTETEKITPTPPKSMPSDESDSESWRDIADPEFLEDDDLGEIPF